MRMREVVFALVAALVVVACTPKEEPKEEQKKAEPTPAIGPTVTPPVEQKPGEQRPAGQKPGEQKPGEQKPGEQKPGEQKPGEQQPGEQKPGEQKPGGQGGILKVTPEEQKIFDRVLGAEAAPVEDPNKVSEGQMRVKVAEDKLVALPLAHTRVEADVSGVLARAWVTQYFTNPFDHPIEAIYVFPLPQNAAVDDMEMVIGERVIKGVMKKREEAKKDYEEAKKQGKTASLLEQERPNLFTQSVANILPGDKIRVRIRYVEDLKYEEGGYEFVFPMVVGPRYIPGTPSGKQAGGWSPDTNQVPDASRITPPVLKPGERSGHDIEVSLTINSGVEVLSLTSPSHEIVQEKLEGYRVRVTLKPFDTLPNKDFIVRYKTAGEALQVAALFHKSDLGAYFMLLFQPEAAPASEVVVNRELVFVVDCSGSMHGTPITKVKEAMAKVIKGMRPTDKFQIVTFSMTAEYFSPQPVEATPENVKNALQYIDRIEAGGGTQMMEGIKAALDYPLDPTRVRIVSFMTDGYIGNEEQILTAVREKLRSARLFSFGIGSSVNRYLLDGLAQMGKGAVTYVRQDESPDAAVERFYRRIEAPVLTDVTVTLQGPVKLLEPYPDPIPDLFTGQPLVIHGKYEGSGEADFVVTGKRGNGEFRQVLRVVFPDKRQENGVLATLWARTRIGSLMTKMRGETEQGRSALVEEVTRLAIAYRIMSQYTAFVAIEEQVRNVDGKLETVQVPVPMPEGVSYEGVFGREQEARTRAVPQASTMGFMGAGGGSMSGIGGSFGTKDMAAAAGEGAAPAAAAPAGADPKDAKKKEPSAPLPGPAAEPQAKVMMTVTGFVGGKLEWDATGKVIRLRLGAVKHCYQKVLKTDPALAGKLVLTIKVDLDGRPTILIAKNELGKDLAKCVIGRMATWVFPKPEGKEAEFKVTFEFKVE